MPIWNNAGSDVVWANGASDIAEFSGTGGLVTINTGVGVRADGLQFDVTGYTIGANAAGDVLNLTGTSTPTITVTNLTDSDTISASLTGTSGFTINSGAGTLVLTGNNSGLTGVVSLTAAETLRAQGIASALGLGTLSLSAGTLQLAGDTGLAFLRNTTVSGTTTITSDRVTAASPGVTHTLGTLSINGSTLNITKGTNVSSGTAGTSFLATTITAGPAIFNVGTGAVLTLGPLNDGGFGVIKSGVGQLVLSSAERHHRRHDHQ